MRTVSIRLEDLAKMAIKIGFVGENEHTRVRIDCKKAFEEYPNAAAALTVQPPAGEAYPDVTTRDGDTVIWDVEDHDLTDEGDGEFQLSFVVDETVMKSYIGRTTICRSILPAGNVPAAIDDWLTRANAALAEIPVEIAAALEEAKESGEFDGRGISDAVLNSDYTLTLYFTDDTSYTTPSIKGEKGEDGQDGFSPTASVSKSGSTATITITDKTGTTTAQVTDGEDGETGATPVISIGTVSTLAPGSDATASMDTTDPEHPVLSLGIPEGEPGDATIDDTKGIGDTDFVWSADKDAKEITNIQSALDTLIDGITEDKTIAWSDAGTTNYPNGWAKGYYNVSTGETVSSNVYIRSNSTYYFVNKEATLMELFAPEGYRVSAYEYKPDGTYVGMHGSITTPTIGSHTFFTFEKGNKFRFAMGKFNNEADSVSHLSDANFLATCRAVFYTVPQFCTKKDRTGNFEFFTVTVDRPLAFGEEEVIDPEEAQEIECVLRLPTSYTRAGTPTRLVLACHGASGYIQASSNKWYNSNWKAFMDSLLAAGYAVFDSNVLPTSTGTNQMGFAVGSPYYVNVLKKAYDYIVYNYNVYPEIFAHGTSMGGVGATAFSFAYPELVLAESSFAGRSIIQYLNYLYNEEETDRFAIAYGYDDIDELNEDHFSHVAGLFPELSLVRVDESELKATAINGDDYCLESTYSENLAPDRETDYSNWLNYFGRIDRLGRTENAGIWTGKRSVPYKAWNCWGDNESHTKIQIVLKDAYNRGNACPYYTIEYDISDAEVEEFREQFQDPNLTRHSFMSYGMIYDMRDQLIAWYKRWE